MKQLKRDEFFLLLGCIAFEFIIAGICLAVPISFGITDHPIILITFGAWLAMTVFNFYIFSSEANKEKAPIHLPLVIELGDGKKIHITAVVNDQADLDSLTNLKNKSAMAYEG